ncbi:bifunctional 4-hydroxy-3-methylbut-2-enyl diphosphate reductase/30S ribosomal protein S1 [Clostridiisalibacter paucivorans]|uniref:bifunctional 4-hydroxy-3-methylbut-2-enyl diphosphate reductase/30S ribosomal protein S1 n=1 Tax=Clostridiisalibacter paucivorans TaxID=408753 RepID=UPI0004798CD8|nr:bifunctional 4-hydroxy-3-methylbut-2-enyl diphosphate reductase/30S ribosomal protein S1 [Clostridiisalibacter paucivorans]
MKIILAENSGFCFGVKKAIDTAMESLKKNDNAYSLGALIHNKQVIKKLNDMGLSVIEDLSNIKQGKLIIRSHGVPLSLYSKVKNKDIDIIDSTCPFVRKIQNKVNKYSKENYKIVIIGNPIHPEVIGINGWCNNEAYIVNSQEDIEHIKKCDKICIVAQTTMTQEKFENLSYLISQKANESKVFNTICSATRLRQESCFEVSKMVDAMIVIGGYHSSNTQKLAEISRRNCSNTYHIETIDDLPLQKIKKYKTIGITAGASTPDWIIKEVVNTLSNIDNDMDKMMKEIEESMVQLKRGEIVKGTVISVNSNEVMVNIGYKSDGIIEKSELSNDPFINPEDMFKPGDEIDVYVVKVDDGEGNVLLSKKRVDNIKGWEELEDIYKNGEKINAKIVEIVKGGAIAVVNNLRAFIPASHVSVEFVKDLNEFLGKDMVVKIIEIDKDKKRIIVSRKEVEKEEIKVKRDKLWESLEKGQIIDGEVKRITNFGAFVDIGGIDGLVHISELSWGRVDHPSEIVSEGDDVKVIVLDFDKSKGRISLGLKQTKAHPWENIDEKYNIGDIIEGKVVKLVDFGVFVELEPGLDGLVHISEISHKHIAKPSDVLAVGDTVKVKILDIKKEEKRVSLSMKELEDMTQSDENYENDNSDLTIGDIVE